MLLCIFSEYSFIYSTLIKHMPLFSCQYCLFLSFRNRHDMTKLTFNKIQSVCMDAFMAWSNSQYYFKYNTTKTSVPRTQKVAKYLLWSYKLPCLKFGTFPDNPKSASWKLSFSFALRSKFGIPLRSKRQLF